MRDWVLLYSISRDGVSMQTFYALTKNRDNTVLLIKDQDDRVFGAFCCEAWHSANYFYGRGESFVFTFGEDDDFKVFTWAGEDE